MINTKTSIKLLRHLGIALIALPEPITTPFGAALVLTSRYLSRRLEANLSKRIRETVKQYLAHFKRFKYDAADESSASRRVKRCTQSDERLILWQYKGIRSVEDNHYPSLRKSWPDAGRDIVHHALDIESFSRRYKVDWSDASSSVGKVIYHTIDIESLSRRYKADWSDTSSGVEKVIHHTINMATVLRLYGSEVGSKPVLKTH